ncbi:TlpA family protein disulfide reductase [Sphingobacterium lactis]|uniref:Thiol-disulfide isomerase or thioredoxin n=1 Tax=Sphingobacterium lactis TaxID=797291 RepID=A0A1H6CMZ2_9SPHI|nr:TlpA disulfide reductase family protein [Sphingobacterium lactis]SEG74117.1 Thiol-disulfide isomerase or thioredoxin [Sphingobacterium lactis]
MTTQKSKTKNIISWVIIGALALVVLIPDSRVALQRGLMKIGLFKPEVKEQPQTSNASSATPMVMTESVTLSDETGKTFSTHDLKGKVVFINFWATWCGPCRAEMPSIQAIYDKYKDHEQVAFLLVEVDHNIEGAKAFLAKEKLNLPVYYPESAIPQAWMSDAIPSTVVLNKQGALAFDHKGMADYSTKEFEDFLISLINQ